jgi:phosphohistidine swiveling domain-containing protein
MRKSASIKLLKSELITLKDFIGANFILSKEKGAEFIQSPTPFSFSILKVLFSYDGSIGNAYRKLNIGINPYDIDRFAVLFGGTFYLNLRVEEEFLYQKYGLHYQVRKDDISITRRGINPLKFARLLKYSGVQKSIVKNIESYTTEFDGILNDWRVLSLELDSKEKDWRKLVDLLQKNIELLLEDYSDIYRFQLIEEVFFQYVSSKLGDRFDERYLTPSSNKRDLYQESIRSIDMLSEEEITLEDFIDKYGTRSFNDFEFNEPRWEEIPDQIIRISLDRHESTSGDFLHGYGLSPDDNHSYKRKDRKLMSQLRDVIVLKGNLRFYILRRIRLIRQILLRLDDILELDGLIFYLNIEEITNVGSQNLKGLRASAHKRMEVHKTYKDLDTPQVVTPRSTFESSISNAKSHITGLVVSPGKVKGELIFVNNPLQKIKPGMIIVLPNAEPEYSHMYDQAKGIIFENGNMLSHGATIARNFRIPAIIPSNPERIRGWEGLIVLIESEKERISLEK